MRFVMANYSRHLRCKLCSLVDLRLILNTIYEIDGGLWPTCTLVAWLYVRTDTDMSKVIN